MRSKPKPNSYLVWQGPSLLDSQPIGVFVTIKSDNEKTGNMIQATIIRLDCHPVMATRDGSNGSVCGAGENRCKHAGEWSDDQQRFVNITCYVQVGKGPSSIYNAYKRGNIPTATIAEIAHKLTGRNVRLGAYGDPAAVPTAFWSELTSACKRHTAYTHQWQHASLQGVAMASVDTLAEYQIARAMGYRTFRVKSDLDPMMPGEIICPASAEAGYKTECNRCTLCDGSRGTTDKRANIVINVHGAGAGNFVSLASMRA